MNLVNLSYPDKKQSQLVEFSAPLDILYEHFLDYNYRYIKLIQNQDQ